MSGERRYSGRNYAANDLMVSNLGKCLTFVKGQNTNMHSPLPAQSIDHYENFPVASWLCPKPLRAPIAAIYHFARTADDLADEGDASAAQRLASLRAYRQALAAAAAGQVVDGPWRAVFNPLGQALQSK